MNDEVADHFVFVVGVLVERDRQAAFEARMEFRTRVAFRGAFQHLQALVGQSRTGKA